MCPSKGILPQLRKAIPTNIPLHLDHDELDEHGFDDFIDARGGDVELMDRFARKHGIDAGSPSNGGIR